MFLNLAIYFIPTLLIMVVCHILFHKEYTLKEFLAQAGASFLIILTIIAFTNFAQLTDYKVVHGVVESKNDIVKQCRRYWATYQDSWCEHHDTRVETSESCSTTNGKRSCITTHTTYYLPTFDWERKFFVYTTIGEYKIEREDLQGTVFPQRYNIVQNGDPVSGYVSYPNYVGAASTSLFKYKDDKYAELKVKRNKIYDYYQIDQVYLDGVYHPSVKNLNKKMQIINSKFKSGANVTLFITDKPEDFANSLQVKWKGFKINDVVVVLGVDKTTQKYQYVNVFSWSESSMVEVELRDYFLNSDFNKIETDMDNIVDIVDSNFKEADPNKFKYLKSQIELPMVSIVILIMFQLIVTPIVTYHLAKD